MTSHVVEPYNPIGQTVTLTRYADAAGTLLVATTTSGYDQANRLTSLIHALGTNGATTLAYALQYDANNQITQLTTPDGSNGYTLDHTGQLTSATLTEESYTYDASGNRTSSAGSGTVTGADNRIAEDATYTYAYDDEGNLTSRTRKDDTGSQTFTWDYRNRLTQVVTEDGNGNVTLTATYAYDAFDRRIRRTVTGSQTLDEQYLYEGTRDADVVLITDGAGAATLRQLNAPGMNQVLAEDRLCGTTTTSRWTLADHEGSIRDVIDNAGTVADHLVYDSFGNILSQSSAAEQPRATYTGAPTDAETGFIYLHHRYFDPTTGRFISQDPLSFAAGDMNVYRYVGNSPLTGTDPSGLCKDNRSWFQKFSDAMMGNDDAVNAAVDNGFANLNAAGAASRDFLNAPVKGLDFMGRMFTDEADAQARQGNVTVGTLANAEAKSLAYLSGVTNLLLNGDRVAGALGDQASLAYQQTAGATGSSVQGSLAAASYLVGELSGTNRLLEGMTGQRLLTGEQIQGGWMGQVGVGAEGISQLAFGAAGLEGSGTRPGTVGGANSFPEGSVFVPDPESQSLSSMRNYDLPLKQVGNDGVASYNAMMENLKAYAEDNSVTTASGGRISNVPQDTFAPNANITTPYVRPAGAGPTVAQLAAVQGQPCVQCGRVTPTQVADHIEPLSVEYYRTGANDIARQSGVGAVQPHCPTCSNIQGGLLSAFSRRMRKVLGI